MIKSDQTAFIFARGGSKGVKDKNIRVIGGKPLIAHTILSAFKSKYIDNVIVSTDSSKIANVAKEYGAKVLARPDHLAADDTPEILAWRHAIDKNKEVLRGQNFISLPATSPLRAPEDIDNAIETFYAKKCDILFGITDAHRNPYLNMVYIAENDLLKIAIEGSTAVRRQDVPKMYDITTCIYVASLGHVQNCARLIDGNVGYVKIPEHRSIDIDTEYDLHCADLMLQFPFEKK